MDTVHTHAVPRYKYTHTDGLNKGRREGGRRRRRKARINQQRDKQKTPKQTPNNANCFYFEIYSSIFTPSSAALQTTIRVLYNIIELHHQKKTNADQVRPYQVFPIQHGRDKIRLGHEATEFIRCKGSGGSETYILRNRSRRANPIMST